jgi:hypothetical protein
MLLTAVLQFSGFLRASQRSAAQEHSLLGHQHSTASPPASAVLQQWQLCTGFSWAGPPCLQLITGHTCLVR